MIERIEADCCPHCKAMVIKTGPKQGGPRDDKQVKIDDVHITMHGRYVELLHLLLEAHPHAIHKEDILKKMWGNNGSENSYRTYISRLNKFLEPTKLYVVALKDSWYRLIIK